LHALKGNRNGKIFNSAAGYLQLATGNSDVLSDA